MDKHAPLPTTNLDSVGEFCRTLRPSSQQPAGSRFVAAGGLVMDAYPERPSHYAHKLTRLLFSSGAVSEIGSSAALLVIHIAHMEDSIRYRGPVRMWNGQISSVLGFNSPKQLEAARGAAIKGGWLHYRRANNRSIGEYWTTTPDMLILSENGMNVTDILSENGTESGMNTGTNTGTNSGKTSIPIPCALNPSPESIQEAAPLSPGGDCQKPSMTPAEFVERWNKWAASKGMATVRKVTEDRRKKIKARLVQKGWIEDFREALKRLPIPGDGWQPDLDWFVRCEGNVSKILEGKYDWRGTVTSGGNGKPQTEPVYEYRIAEAQRAAKAALTSKEVPNA